MLSVSMIEKPLDQIGGAELHALVASRRSEGRTLDFKVTFPGTSDRAVKDFLADVTAFANTDGGDIVIGVREDGNGVAAEIVGIASETLDRDILRIEDQLRNCVDPRVPHFRPHKITLTPDTAALVLRIGASAVAPHRVTYGNTSRFYARNSRGNYEMSTSELRRAVLASDEAPRKIRDLHRRAVEAVSGRDMPCRLEDGPTVVLTVAPISVLRDTRDISISRENAVLPAGVSAGAYMVVGLDGLIAHSMIDRDTKAVRSWSINHRRGYVDFAWLIGEVKNDKKTISRQHFEPYIRGVTRSTIVRLTSIGIEGPWVAMATLVGVRGYSVTMPDYYFTEAAWQDPAFLGEIVDDTLGPKSLQPFIDGFWRLFGVEQAPPLGP